MWARSLGSRSLTNTAQHGMQVAPSGDLPLGFRRVRSAVPSRPLYLRDRRHGPGTRTTASCAARRANVHRHGHCKEARDRIDRDSASMHRGARQQDEDPSAPRIVPTNREAAQVLGWRITRFNRKLDNVCDRLSTAGVGGLREAAQPLPRTGAIALWITRSPPG